MCAGASSDGDSPPTLRRWQMDALPRGRLSCFGVPLLVPLFAVLLTTLRLWWPPHLVCDDALATTGTYVRSFSAPSDYGRPGLSHVTLHGAVHHGAQEARHLTCRATRDCCALRQPCAGRGLAAGVRARRGHADSQARLRGGVRRPARPRHAAYADTHDAVHGQQHAARAAQ